MLRLLTPRVMRSAALRHRQLELDEPDFARARELFIAALQGGRQLLRPAMYAVLDGAGIASAGQRGIHILSQLSMEGLLCFAGREGKQPAFALLEEWLPPGRSLERESALAEIAQRYFTGHGPATLQDFAWWTGLTMGDARAALELARPGLVEETVEGQPYWLAAATPPAFARPAGVHLLPGFDEYVVAYRHRGAILDPEHRERINPGSNGMFSNSIVDDGRIVGTWRRERTKRGVSLRLHPFGALDARAARGSADAAERYGRFLGLPVSVVDGPERASAC
jgi:hypothetical protein